MLTATKLNPSNSAINAIHNHTVSLTVRSDRFPHHLRLPIRRFSSPTARSYCNPTQPRSQPSETSELEPSVSSPYTATVGSASSSSLLQLSQWNLTHRHILALNVIACALFQRRGFSSLQSQRFSKAAESLEKLMDVTTEELPDTMAAIRLSGMEISDLTMELSDLGQEITQGVRSSTRTVRIAEERLRGLTNMAAPRASLQRVGSPKSETRGGPALARSAREMKEGIVRGRAILQMFFTLARLSRMALTFFASRAKQ